MYFLLEFQKYFFNFINMKNKIYHILISFALALMLTTAYMTHDTHAISAEYTIKICTKTMW